MTPEELERHKKMLKAKYLTQKADGEFKKSNFLLGTHKRTDIGVTGETAIDSRPGFEAGAGGLDAMGAIGIATTAAQVGANLIDKDRPEGKPKSGASAFLGGASQGASMGAATGNPIVAGAAAVVGGTIGLINQQNEMKQWRKDEQRKEEIGRSQEAVYGHGLIDAAKTKAFKKYVG